MSNPSDYFNSLPIEEREKIAPALTETRVNTIKTVREIFEKHRRTALAEIDLWLMNNEKRQ